MFHKFSLVQIRALYAGYFLPVVLLLDSQSLRSSETSFNFHQTARHRIPEDGIVFKKLTMVSVESYFVLMGKGAVVRVAVLVT
jgi:hypothetical protein